MYFSPNIDSYSIRSLASSLAPLLAKVWDGSEGRVGDNLGYNLCFAVRSRKRISQRMFEMPDFLFYAIADGVSMLFTRHGRWNGLDGPNECDEPKDLFQTTLAI